MTRQCTALMLVTLLSALVSTGIFAADDCCTPEATAKLAAAGGFVDIVGIKLGMPAQQAVAAMKAAVPNASITEDRTLDYEKAFWPAKPQDDPKKQWITNITANAPSGEQILLGITTPPNPAVVNSMGRSVRFPQPLAVENVVAGLRKKYGPESLGPDFRLSGSMPVFDSGTGKTFLWLFDTQGQQVKSEQRRNCPTSRADTASSPWHQIWEE